MLPLLAVVASCDKGVPATAATERALTTAQAIAAADASVALRLAPRADGFLHRDADSSKRVTNVRASAKANDLSAALPARADGAVEISFHGALGNDATVTLEGARNVPVAVDRGRAVYANVFDETDRVFSAGEGSFEEAFVLYGPRAPRTFTWSVTAGERIARVAPRGDGLAFERAGGAPAFVIEKPFAIDARGARIELALAWNEDARQFRVSLPSGPLAYPVLVDPVFQTWAWAAQPSAVNPGVLDNIRMVFDPEHSNVVLFTPSAQTWLWNGTWSRVMPLVSPPAQPLAMAFDEARRNVVGYSSAGSTWTWDGNNWTMKTSALTPGARGTHLLAYDGNTNSVLLFGGAANADTWLWNGTSWSKPVVTTSPPARSSFGMAWDPERRHVVVFGGSTADGLQSDTWTWNGSTWLNRTPTRAPSRRLDFPMVYDANEKKIVVVDGFFAGGFADDSWLWDGVTWAPIDQLANRPIPRSGHGLAYDVNRKASVLFGGTDFYTDTWLLYRLGAACATNADCPGAFCTDGVCCAAASCGVCESCATTRRGECAPVSNADDPDTCSSSDGKSCSALGDCKLALGKSASTAEACASGFLVDGVCCNSPCTGSCVACSAELKESGTLSGVCDNARSGTDVRDHCLATDAAGCGLDGTCDGRGACRVYPGGAACGASSCIDNRATGKVCNGQGECTDTAGGIACGFFSCVEGAGCKTFCATKEDCNSRSHCEMGRCVPDEGASCDGDHTVVSPDGARRDCSPNKCEGALCRTSCNNVNDCAFPAQCSSEGKCVGFVPGADDGGGGCSLGATRESSSGGCAGAIAIAGLALTLRRVRKRRVSI